MLKKIIFSGLFVSSLLLSVCCFASFTSQPILNLSNQQVPSSLTANQVKECLHLAGTKKKWLMEDVKPGLIRATLYIRQHEAKIDIAYSEKSYSINYHSSLNLGYDGKTIHRNYNKWIKLLNESIQMNLHYMPSK